METVEKTTTPLKENQRLEIVDALRGFAMLAIVLLHNLEHYNLFYNPEYYPDWLVMLDKGVWDFTWATMAGKAFSTFSLLFGFSFFIQLNSRLKRGEPFLGRFAWRMVILVLIAQFHAIFYNGDILLVYAVVGLLLIPCSFLSNRWLLIISTILILQPLEWYHIIASSVSTNYIPPVNHWMEYLISAQEVMKDGNFCDIVVSNLTDGQMFNNLWQVSAGRLFQIPALFMLGMLLGRLNYFKKSKESVRFWVGVAVISIAALILPLTILKNHVPSIIENEMTLTTYNTIFGSLWNFAYTACIVSCFALLWFYKGNGYKMQRFIIPYGRMSLTNYLVQSFIGCAIYLDWGLGLYKHTGATFSILIGIVMFIFQLWFSSYWLKRHKQGPFEWIWKKLTWIKL